MEGKKFYNIAPRCQSDKTFNSLVYKFSKKAIVFVPEKPFHIMFAGKARSLS
jgi:hypothetical protein